jgi:hypothetical protein
MGRDRRGAALNAPLKDALAAVGAALRERPGTGMIIGGVAVIARGVARVTRDVDVSVAIASGEGLASLVAGFGRHALVPRIEDALAFARTCQVLLLRHAPSGVDVDVSIAWLPFELEALAAAEQVRLSGIDVPIARAEDLVIYKSVAWRPQDQQDVERLLTLHGAEVDLRRIQRIVAEFAEALEDPDRVREVQRVIERALAHTRS